MCIAFLSDKYIALYIMGWFYEKIHYNFMTHFDTILKQWYEMDVYLSVHLPLL